MSTSLHGALCGARCHLAAEWHSAFRWFDGAGRLDTPALCVTRSDEIPRRPDTIRLQAASLPHNAGNSTCRVHPL